MKSFYDHSGFNSWVHEQLNPEETPERARHKRDNRTPIVPVLENRNKDCEFEKRTLKEQEEFEDQHLKRHNAG